MKRRTLLFSGLLGAIAALNPFRAKAAKSAAPRMTEIGGKFCVADGLIRFGRRSGTSITFQNADYAFRGLDLAYSQQVTILPDNRHVGGRTDCAFGFKQLTGDKRDLVHNLCFLANVLNSETTVLEVNFTDDAGRQQVLWIENVVLSNFGIHHTIGNLVTFEGARFMAVKMGWINSEDQADKPPFEPDNAPYVEVPHTGTIPEGTVKL